MIISHKYKFIFIKTRKTAGSSIQMYLSQFCSEGDIFTRMDQAEQFYTPRNYRGLFTPFIPITNRHSNVQIFQTFLRFMTLTKFHSHISARNIRAFVPDKVWNEYYKFAVDRNPWDKVLSHYHYSRQRFGKYDNNISLDDFISNGDLPYNYHKYTDRDGKLMLDRIIPYENLIEDLGKVFNMLGIPFEGSLKASEKSHYRTDKRPYQDVYTEEQAAKIASLFENEIRMHGYTFS